MDNEVVEEILTRIDSLGDLSMQGFEILMQQVIVEAVSNSLWALGLALLAVVLFVASSRIHQGKLINFELKCDRSAWTVITGALGTISMFVSLGMATSAIKYFLNPEFYAIKWILESF